jgi:hypothetical protein
MNLLHRHPYGAEAWPISRERSGYSPMLTKVIVASRHPDGRGEVHLTPNQALYAQSRLSMIKVAFLNGHQAVVYNLGTEHLPAAHADMMNDLGAKVWPIIDDETSAKPVLKDVVLESRHPDGYGLVHLTPDDAAHVEERLTQITLAFLHENVWGGEDARRQ